MWTFFWPKVLTLPFKRQFCPSKAMISSLLLSSCTYGHQPWALWFQHAVKRRTGFVHKFPCWFIHFSPAWGSLSRKDFQGANFQPHHTCSPLLGWKVGLTLLRSSYLLNSINSDCRSHYTSLSFLKISFAKLLNLYWLKQFSGAMLRKREQLCNLCPAWLHWQMKVCVPAMCYLSCAFICLQMPSYRQLRYNDAWLLGHWKPPEYFFSVSSTKSLLTNPPVQRLTSAFGI